MIKQSQIEEWIKEAEERPASAAIIIRFLANRLVDLTKANEELRAENIELRYGNKVEEYENKIANLEHQIELLSRQVQESPAPPDGENKELLIYNRFNQVLRKIVGESQSLITNQTLASFEEAQVLRENEVHLKSLNASEEILLIFDTGHVKAVPVSLLPAITGDTLSWDQAYEETLELAEELVDILPIARLPLYEYCVQTSRRGFVKKMPVKSFNTYIAQKNIGTGIRQQPDKPFNLTLCNADETFALVSKEGYVVSMPVEKLPFAIEAVINLGVNDYIVASFALSEADSLMIVTKDGKIVHRDPGWLTPAKSFRTQGQSLYSRKVRERGTQVIGAAPIKHGDWGIFLDANGVVSGFPIEEILNRGFIFEAERETHLLAFTTLQV